jgi:uncharacterized protein involved in exopolysaccharide biosynthesis
MTWHIVIAIVSGLLGGLLGCFVVGLCVAAKRGDQ